MANFRYSSQKDTQATDRFQPRRLSQQDRTQVCSWVNCSSRAVSEHKKQVYCASHLLKTLQRQWEG